MVPDTPRRLYLFAGAAVTGLSASGRASCIGPPSVNWLDDFSGGSHAALDARAKRSELLNEPLGGTRVAASGETRQPWPAGRVFDGNVQTDRPRSATENEA
jgi:hypothetical protein